MHPPTTFLTSMPSELVPRRVWPACPAGCGDEVADPLVTHKQMSARHLALHFLNHIPPWIRRVTEAEMKRTDKKRRKKKEALVTKDELLQMAKDHEAELLETEAEQRAATLMPAARDTHEYAHQGEWKEPEHKRIEDRLTPRMEDRLGNKTQEERGEPRVGRVHGPETRSCNTCHKVGHIAANCNSHSPKGRLPGPPAGEAPRASTPRPDYAKHKTEGAVCGECQRPGHVAAQCWKAHPELMPAEAQKRRQGAMATLLRKRQRAAEHVSPEYDFIAMALSYQRPEAAMMQERAPRMSQPSQRAREAAIGGPQPSPRTTRRVGFNLTPDVPPAVVAPVTLRPTHPLTSGFAVMAPATLRLADPLTANLGTATYQDVQGVPEKYAFRERLPQSFPHGMPPSSLEPGATDQ